MSKKNKKTSVRKTEPRPEDFKSEAENRAAMEEYEEYLKNKPIYTILNFFIGGPNTVDRIKNNVEGKPPTY